MIDRALELSTLDTGTSRGDPEQTLSLHVAHAAETGSTDLSALRELGEFEAGVIQTDAPAPATSRPIDAPYWANETGLEGMGLAVQRAKRAALRHCASVHFGEARAEVIPDEDRDGSGATLAYIDVILPGDVDGLVFRDAFFADLMVELSSDDAARLAVNVI